MKIENKFSNTRGFDALNKTDWCKYDIVMIQQQRKCIYQSVSHSSNYILGIN